MTLDQTLDHTFYTLRLVTVGQAQREQATGWWAARFHCEAQSREGLKPLAHYQGNGETEEVDEAAALKDWAKRVDARFKRRSEPR